MSKYLLIIIFLITFLSGEISAQGPGRKDFGFGIILGEPTGGTVKLWTNPVNAFVFDLGASYFGSPRIGVDYLWHFDAFHSNIVEMYAGPGMAIGIGEGNGLYNKNNEDLKHQDESGLGIRGVFGVNVIPEDVPLEIFFEIGTLIGLVPDFGAAVDAAIGVRFYP